MQSESKRRKMSALGSSSNNIPTTNTTDISDATVPMVHPTDRTFDFMECIPLKIRMEIYSMVHDFYKPIRSILDSEDPNYDLDSESSEDCSWGSDEVYDRLEPQIHIAAILHDGEALHLLLPPIQDAFFQNEAARTLAKYGCWTALLWYCQNYKILKRIRRVGPRGIMWFAAKDGDRTLLEWLRKKGCDWKDTCPWAAKMGYFKILKYAHEHGCDWDEETCRYAAEMGHLDILKYAHEHDCPWDEETCSLAVWMGHMDILKYAHEHGCPWHEETCSYAAMKGHLDILKYAHEQGCPWGQLTCDLAEKFGHSDILRYVRKNGCPKG